MQLKTAMILAAGTGGRLKPLVDVIPKPLLPVAGKSFIVHHLERLAVLKFERVVINVHHFSEQIMGALGNGKQFGLEIVYSKEPALLGPGGGIHNALALIGRDPFLLLSGDIYTDFPLAQLLAKEFSLGDNWIHAILTNKPSVRKGDFAFNANQLVVDPTSDFVYASIAVMDPVVFEDQAPGHASLMPAFNKAIAAGRATGSYYPKVLNINTLEEYSALINGSKNF